MATKDRISVVVNTVMFFRITDVRKVSLSCPSPSFLFRLESIQAAYEIDDVFTAVEEKAITSIRSIISRKNLDEARPLWLC